MLDRLANWKSVLVIFLTAVVIFNLGLFPWRSARLKEIAGRDVGIVDTMFAYTPDQVYQKISAYGVQGRQLYALTELTIDLVYPVLYNLFLILTTTLVFRQVFPGQSAWQKLRYLPFAVWASDYAENICIAILLLSYPQQLNVLAWVASFFTTTKWSLGIVSLGLIVMGLRKWLISIIHNRVTR